NSRAESCRGRLPAWIDVLAPPRFCRLHRGACAHRRRRSAVGDPGAAGKEISGASAGARLGRRQHAGREITVQQQSHCEEPEGQRSNQGRKKYRAGLLRGAGHRVGHFGPTRWLEMTRAYAAIASSRRLVTGGPNPPITTKTIAIAPAIKLNTPTVP